MLSGLLALSALALVAFHVWLFWGQVQVGRLADPLTAARWASSALLAVALVVLHRKHAPLFHGRQALVIWTLIALVHVGPGAAQADPGVPHAPAIVFVVPAIAGAALFAAWALLRAVGPRRAVHVGRSAALLVSVARQSLPRSPLLAVPRPLRAPPVVAA
jgi:hypothetical protein